MKKDAAASYHLAASITRSASKQTDYTIRLLVDRDRMADAYRAYAYFRWVDDQLDQVIATRPERLAFLDRQRDLMCRCYQAEWPLNPQVEERMVVDLIRGNCQQNTGLQTYLDDMMAVMAFDADRRGRLISQIELADYARLLATAVTEALHYFIGHDAATPPNGARYAAVTGAHISHMLRDTIEDVSLGYFNIPVEFLERQGISPRDVNSDGYRMWVRSRVDLARAYFQAGRSYLAELSHLRCRIAGYAYMARFEGVLAAIEREGYRLRPAYPENQSWDVGLQRSWSALLLALTPRRRRSLSRTLPTH